MKKTLLMTVLLGWSAIASAEELALIVSKNSPLASLTKAEAQQVFFGQSRAVKGASVQPLDLPAGSGSRDAFYQQYFGRNQDQMLSYWARLIFTGKGKPPREVKSASEMLSLVSGSDAYIGYVPATAVTDKVRVISFSR